MPTTLNEAIIKYLCSGSSSRGTRAEYHTTIAKWSEWGNGVPLEQLGRKDIREFLDWVYERAVAEQGTNPGRTANKAREHFRAIILWAWEHDIIESPPRFPKARSQRDVAGRHFLTKKEINALYFATHLMQRPRGGMIRFLSVDTGAVRSSYSSTTDWIPVPSGNRHLLTSPFFGDTYVGGVNLQTATSSNSPHGAGCFIAGSRPAKRFTAR